MEKLLTTKEVADVLVCHPKSVYRNKELPHIKIPGIGKRFRLSDVNAYIEQKTVKSQSLLNPQITPKSFKLTNLEDFDKLYLKETIGGKSVSMKGTKRRWNYGFGSVYLRKTKQGKIRWYVDYHVNGERIREVVQNAQGRAEAVLHLREKTIEAFNSLHNSGKIEKPIAFAELSESYLNDYAKLNKKTWNTDKYHLKVNMMPFFGKFKLKEITPLIIEKYRAKRLESGISKSTVNRELALMKKMFNLAIDWEMTSENPVRKIKFFSETDNLKERILTLEEEGRLLSMSADYLKPILVVALNTGMRRGEILNLRWDQVDLENKLIRVEKTKSGKPRFISMNSVLDHLLQKVNNNSEFVFSNPSTGKPYVDVKKAFRIACEKADINELRFHDLRHTFASRLVENGVDLITVKELLGHSTVKMTERYTHPSQSLKKEAVEALVRKAKARPKKVKSVAHECHTEKKRNAVRSVNRSYSIN